MSRAIVLRFTFATFISVIYSGCACVGRVMVLVCVCLSLGGCVEGVDLPEFLTDMHISVPSSQKSEVEDFGESDGYHHYEQDQARSEGLLEAKGNWNLVEQGGAMDPTKAHLMARESVNVRRRKTKKELSAHFHPDAKSGEDGKMRVLRLERDGKLLGGDSSKYDLAETSVVKPSHTVAESDLLQKIRELFGEEKAESQEVKEETGVVVPARKPYREAVSDIKKVSHVVGGIVVPPSLPVRKLSGVSSSRQAVAGKGVIVPPVKPVVSGSNALMSKEPLVSAVKVRSGKHKGKTRLVIEITQPTEYKVAIDHVRNVLRLKLDNTRWDLPVQDRFDNSDLLGTYIVREQSDGSVLFEVRLGKKSRIIDTMLLRPNMSSRHRVVIDLKE